MKGTIAGLDGRVYSPMPFPVTSAASNALQRFTTRSKAQRQLAARTTGHSSSRDIEPRLGRPPAKPGPGEA